eukprot:scaffold15229_cov163-Isochrysis_galbana.AAC.3
MTKQPTAPLREVTGVVAAWPSCAPRNELKPVRLPTDCSRPDMCQIFIAQSLRTLVRAAFLNALLDGVE